MNGKLETSWSGPYQVVEIIVEVKYRLGLGWGRKKAGMGTI